MKILVSEFITGGGLIDEPLPASLAKEGHMMLNAIVSDLSDLDDVEIEITLDPRCSTENLPDNNVHIIKNKYMGSLRSLCFDVDAVLIIAPESDDFLGDVSRIIVEERVLLLGSSPDVIKLVSSKAATANYLIEHDIPAIETIMNNEVVDLPESNSGWIVKSDQGAGCEQVIFCETKDQVESAVFQRKKAIVQPMIKGIPASLSMLCNKGECVVIGYNEQIIKWQDNRLRYAGTKVNSLLGHQNQFDQLAESVNAALPELRGYVGMDLIIDNEQNTVVEINPRLTTSYVALKESIGMNPAKMILDIFTHNKLPEINYSNFKEVLVSV